MARFCPRCSRPKEDPRYHPVVKPWGRFCALVQVSGDGEENWDERQRTKENDLRMVVRPIGDQTG